MKEPSLWTKVFLAMLTPWTSRKLWLAMISIFTLISYFWTSVLQLYSFTNDKHIDAFVMMFKQITWAVVVVIVSYLLEIPTILNGFKSKNINTSTEQTVKEIITKTVEPPELT